MGAKHADAAGQKMVPNMSRPVRVRVPGGHLVLFVLLGSGVVIGRGLPHNVGHSHAERLVGRERDVAGQQGWLLHDGIVMGAVRVGIPVTQQGFCVSKTHTKKKYNNITGERISHRRQQVAAANFLKEHEEQEREQVRGEGEGGAEELTPAER